MACLKLYLVLYLWNIQIYVKHEMELEIRVLSVIDISFPTLPVALRLNAGHGLLILEVSRSHTTTHHSR